MTDEKEHYRHALKVNGIPVGWPEPHDRTYVGRHRARPTWEDRLIADLNEFHNDPMLKGE